MYSLALQEMLQVNKVPESFIMPAMIRRQRVPELYQVRPSIRMSPLKVPDPGLSSIRYRNFSCVPVDQRAIHEPLLEALGWNVFISKYVHHIHPAKMFMNNTGNKYAEDFEEIKIMHSVDSGAPEYVIELPRAMALRARGVRSIFDPSVKVSDLVPWARPGSVQAMRLEVLRSADVDKSVFYFPETILRLLEDCDDYVVAYYQRDTRGMIQTDGEFALQMSPRQDSRTKFVVFSSQEVTKLRRQGFRGRVLVIQDILKTSVFLIPWLFRNRLFDMTYAMYKSGLSDRYMNSVEGVGSLENNTRCVADLWNYICDIALGPACAT